MNNSTYHLTIGWLYPQLMSTYGDRGNILVLQKRCEWRGIEVTILPIDQETTGKQIQTVDLLFGGGAQDREQEIVMRDLQTKKKNMTTLIEQNIPALFVCGAPQLMGQYYEPSAGKRIEGLGIFAMHTLPPKKDANRLIGNVIATINAPSLAHSTLDKMTIVGFENHGGHTYLEQTATPLATIIKGYGNNDEDGTEGIIYKNAIGTYLHGPLLPKNPDLADWLITKALEIKYAKEIVLEKIDSDLEEKAKNVIAKRLKIDI
jgi:CobQ-like glutamine amidotransferase family enzyme